MDDICRLKDGLQNPRDPFTQKLYVYFPGLSKLDKVCDKTLPPPEGYDIYEWEHPILLGCLTSEHTDTSCFGVQTHDHVYFRRLYLIKPALPNGQGQQFLGKALAATAEVCRNGVREKACARVIQEKCRDVPAGETYAPYNVNDLESAPPWLFENNASCELIGFAMRNAFSDDGRNEQDQCPDFPQLHTVGMTVNSSPWIFGAYRELGRYYARQLGWFFGTGQNNQPIDDTTKQNRFLEAIKYQKQHPLLPATVLPGQFMTPSKSGLVRGCLGLPRN